MFRAERLIREIAEALAKQIDDVGLDNHALLMALAKQESQLGRFNLPRFERSYWEGGYWWRRSKELQAACTRYGRAAACSWGPWQVMYLNALELGYGNRPPWTFSEPLLGGELAVTYINHRILRRGWHTIEKVADAYNSGSANDELIPHEYVGKVCQYYQEFERSL